MDAFLHDLRYAARGLRKSPGFAAVAVLTLALAIGANTAVFSVLHAVVLQPVAARDPGGLASIALSDTLNHQSAFIYAETFRAFRERQQSFSRLSMYSGGGVLRVEAHGTATDAGVEGVTPEYFELLGVRPAAGRLLIDSDQSIAGAPVPVVVISDRLRQRLFGIDRSVVGDTLIVNGRPLTIVGVAEPGFDGLETDSGTEFWVPFPVLRESSGDPRQPIRARNLIGRLAPGVTIQQALAETQARWPAIQAETIPASASAAEQRTLRSATVTVESIANGFSTLRRQYGTSLVVLMALTAILLLIGCVNISSLVLVRAMRRHQQIAVRIALGASHGRIVQQVIVEALLLVSAGLVVAVPLAWWATRTLTAMMSISRVIPFLRPITPNALVLLVTALASAVTGILVAALPAWRSVRIPVSGTLQRSRPIASTGRTGAVLLVSQVALSMVLAVGAGLFVRSLAHLQANDSLFRNRSVVWTRIWRQPGERGPLDATYWRALVGQLAGIQGVDGVAVSNLFPAYLAFPGALPAENYVPVGASTPSVAALSDVTTPGFFDMFGIRRLRGRDFAWSDDARARPVAILSETAARQLFPGGDGPGRHIRVTERGGAATDLEIVGIVADAPIGLLREPHQAVVFRPFLQQLATVSVPDVHVRFSGDLGSVSREYVRVVESLGHHFVRGLFTLDGWLDHVVLQERLVAGIAVYAAALAVLLGCVGIYGLLAYSVTSRVPEIGVRLALGATRAGVVRLIVRDGLIVVAAGVILGAPCALAAARLMQAQLYGLQPTDPASVIAAAIVFVTTGAVAALLPALRAALIDPMVALRTE